MDVILILSSDETDAIPSKRLLLLLLLLMMLLLLFLLQVVIPVVEIGSGSSGSRLCYPNG